MPHKKSDIEEVLGHLIYLKVIKELATSEQPLTKYRIIVKTGLKSIDVKKALAKLIEMGWILQHETTPRKYSLNYNNPSLRKLVECLRDLGYIPKL